jgi:hypothetical protein
MQRSDSGINKMYLALRNFFPSFSAVKKNAFEKLKKEVLPTGCRMGSSSPQPRRGLLRTAGTKAD